MFRPLQAVVDLVLPPRCPACRVIVADDGRFCLKCWQELVFITEPVCARCGTPFDHDRGAGAECGPCLADTPRFDSARAALAYGGPARTVLLALKHGDRQHLARVMAPHMARAGAALLTADTILVPVPLHWRRLWRRGFNQAALLAQALARISGAELAIDALERPKPTGSSAGMGRRARAKNVRGAFRVKDRNRIRGACVVLVDDVLTTGATAEACARVLRRAGAREVHVLTFARVVRDAGSL
ncbi:phosphoribosyltransferase [Polymorphobacter glacialis]|uniref:Phosphoribosyltransferase n=1 Tax=Sandarakinorhabdus glacialis TaxID=1614636 RepID=A0A917EC74_9SPHN|nr:ComF family protein [Polymorphobacter glacialis]GGE18757.1 phosphoribosyltransferase [Polymorphobacter glacialis]